jgi:universal stress protein A
MSSQIQKIIVPIDFSDISQRAAQYAESLARALHASLCLVHVQPPAGLTPHGVARAADPPDAREHCYQAARRRLDDLARRLRSGTLQVATEVRSGATAENITQAAVHYGADLVVMGTHGRTGVAHFLVGSMAERVIRTAPCPVLVLRSSGKVDVHRASRAA